MGREIIRIELGYSGRKQVPAQWGRVALSLLRVTASGRTTPDLLLPRVELTADGGRLTGAPAQAKVTCKSSSSSSRISGRGSSSRFPVRICMSSQINTSLLTLFMVPRYPVTRWQVSLKYAGLARYLRST